MTIVPANEFFKLDALAVHARNLGEFHRTHNLVFGLTRSGGPCPTGPRRSRRLRIDACNKTDMIGVFTLGCPTKKGIPVTQSA